MGGGQSQEADLAKAASCLAEMASLLQEDLEVERQAEGQLTRGMATGNQTHLATGLQVFYNLGTLASVLDTTVAEMQQRLRTQWTECLDIKRITEAEAGDRARPRCPCPATTPHSAPRCGPTLTSPWRRSTATCPSCGCCSGCSPRSWTPSPTSPSSPRCSPPTLS